MAYDLTGAWKASPVGHHSSVEMTGKALDWAMANGFDLNKVWLGQPTYGIEFPDGKNMSAIHVPHSDIAERLENDPNALRRGKAGNLFFDTVADSRQKSVMAVTRNLSGGSSSN